MKKLVPVLALTLAAAGCSNNDNDDNTGLRVGERVRGSAMLQTFDSCDELGERLRHNVSEQMRTQLLQYAEWYGGRGGYGPPSADAGAENGASDDSASGGGGREEGVDYSGTNNQENGVDEADFVKTNGYNIFVLNGKKLAIFGVPTIGELEATAKLDIEGWPTAMLLGEDELTIFSSVSPWDLPAEDPLQALLADERDAYGWYRISTLTKISVIDVADPAAPNVKRELYLEGWYQTARRIAESVRMISYGWIDVPGLVYWPQMPEAYYQLDWDDPERDAILAAAIIDAMAYNDELLANTPIDDFVPRIYERKDGGVLSHPFTAEGCSNFAIADDGMSRGFTSIMTLDLESADFSFEADHIVTNWSTLYASLETLVVAENAQDWWWYWNTDSDLREATNIHRFDISVPGVTTYTGSGRVDGTLYSQFQLSEKEGEIRVASTTGSWNRWWLTAEDQAANPMQSHVFVLDGPHELTVKGHVGGIGEGELLFAARFVADKAYLVTAQFTDPLWTIDLSDSSNPKIAGELEVPGVSTYIHPLADEHLLTIGYGGNDENIDWSVTQLSLFDVSDFAAPALDATLSLSPAPIADGWTYGYSEATWEHKAFQFWAPLGLLAVPLSTYRYIQYNCNDPYGYSCYHYEYKSGLELVQVDTATGALASYGNVDHSTFFNSDQDSWWSWTDVRRSIFMHDATLGDFVYAISDRGITSTRLDDMTLVDSEQLDGTRDYYYYGEGGVAVD